jgi:hypothetical protein
MKKINEKTCKIIKKKLIIYLKFINNSYKKKNSFKVLKIKLNNYKKD